MKYLINILAILILFSLTLDAQLKVDYGKIKASQGIKLISQGNNLVVCGYQSTHYDGNNWNNVPIIFEKDNGYDTLYFENDKSNVTFDKDGNLYLCGKSNGFFKWDGNKSTHYYLDDLLHPRREYNSVAVDSVGNIWLTADVILAEGSAFINYYTELIKYDGTDYTIVATTKGIPYHLGYGSITVTSDNRVLVTSLTISNNLLIVNPDGEVEFKTMPTPHRAIDSNRFEQRFAKVVDIYEDSESNLWFSLDYNDPKDPGLVVLKNNNEWEAFSEHNNYPLRSSSKGFVNRDSLFKACFGVAEDINGRFWVGGFGFLNYIDENNMLTTPNIDEFLNNSTFYSAERIPDPGEEIPQRKLDFLNSSDSLAVYISEMFNRDWTTKHTLGKIGNAGGKVESMTTTADGSLWIAFTHLGLLRYQPTITSVEDIAVSQNVLLFPQPVSSADKQLNIKFENTQYVTNVSFYDMNGKLMQRNSINSQVTENIEMKLNNNNFIAGTYFAAIMFKDKTIFRKFIIK